MSQHSHENHHHHHHEHEIEDFNKAFIIGIVLNILFVSIEVIAGFYYNSLALISDAGHNLGDVASLLLAFFTFKISKLKPSENFTYGLSKSTVMASLINSLFLLVVVGGILIESLHRISINNVIDGKVVSIVAFIGIFINAFTAFLFHKNKEKDLNLKAAYLHLLSDALVSLGVVVSGIIIYFTKLYWMDSLISILIALIILLSTWSLLKESLKLSLDGVPKNINLAEIKEEILSLDNIKNIHHIHIWAISTSQIALTAHIIVNNEISTIDLSKLRKEIKHLLEHAGVKHSTLELEYDISDCIDTNC